MDVPSGCATLGAMTLQRDLRALRDGGPVPPPPARRPRRWDLALAWLVILLPALTLAAILAARQRVDDLSERMVRDTNALFARTYPRPAHVDPPGPAIPGEGLARHMARIGEAAKLHGSDPVLRQVTSGVLPVSSLPPVIAADLERLEPALEALLGATRGERVELADPCLSSGGDGGWSGLSFAASLVGVRMRLAMAAGDPERALRDGLDGLAVGRDVALGRQLVGRMAAASVVERLAPSLGEAIDRLPGAGADRDASRRLRVIRDALPPFSVTLSDEWVCTQLMIGEALPASARARLDPRARALVERDGLKDTAFWQRFTFRDGWRDMRAAQDALVATADLPETERAAAWSRVQDRLLRQPNPVAAIAMPDFGKYARRAAASVRRLDALVLVAAAGAFRSTRGAWPGAVADLASAGELSAAEAARLGEAELEVARGDGLAITVSLPRGDERDPAEVRFVLRGRVGGY